MPSWRDLKRYCDHTGWELQRNTDHYYYRKAKDDGTFLRTRVSKGSGEIPKNIWQEILKHQLQITQEEFNRNI